MTPGDSKSEPPGSPFHAFLRVLNEAYQADHAAILALVENRVPCNAALADHPTIQVGASATGKTEVGMLGIINGICEAATGKRVAVCIDRQTGEITGFVEYAPNGGQAGSSPAAAASGPANSRS